MSCVKVFFFSFNIWIVNSISLDEQFLLLEQILRKWFEPRSNVPWLKKIIWVIGALRRTVVIDWRFDNLCRSHLQSQVVELVSWKFKNPGERFDWSVDRVAAHVFTANHITHLPTATLSTDQSNRSLGFLNFQRVQTLLLIISSYRVMVQESLVYMEMLLFLMKALNLSMRHQGFFPWWAAFSIIHPISDHF